MATISKFGDLETRQPAGQRRVDINKYFKKSEFLKDRELRNQINASSGSVADNITEGFDRSGNREFFHFLIIAKGPDGEARSQLNGTFDRNCLTRQDFDDLRENCTMLSMKITSFLKYLKNSGNKGFRYK